MKTLNGWKSGARRSEWCTDPKARTARVDEQALAVFAAAMADRHDPAQAYDDITPWEDRPAARKALGKVLGSDYSLVFRQVEGRLMAGR